MRVGREQLIYKALHVLFDAKEAARCGPVPASLGLRFALAYLYAQSDGPIHSWPDHRAVFDAFWKTVRDEGLGKPNDNGVRGAHSQSAFDQICRQVRFVFVDPEHARLARVRDEIARAVREEGAKAEQEKDDRRRYYFHPPPKREDHGRQTDP